MRRTKYDCRLPGNAKPITISASQTKAPITGAMTVDQGIHFRVDVRTSTVVPGTGITLLLQVSPGSDGAGNQQWIDSKSITISSASASSTYHTLLLLAEAVADQPYLPLPSCCRLVVTTPAAASITVEEVFSLG